MFWRTDVLFLWVAERLISTPLTKQLSLSLTLWRISELRWAWVCPSSTDITGNRPRPLLQRYISFTASFSIKRRHRAGAKTVGTRHRCCFIFYLNISVILKIRKPVCSLHCTHSSIVCCPAGRVIIYACVAFTLVHTISATIWWTAIKFDVLQGISSALLFQSSVQSNKT